MQHTLEPRHFEFLVDASGLELKSLAAIGWMLSNPEVRVLPEDLTVDQVVSLCALGANHCLTLLLSKHREPEDEEALFWLVDRWSTEAFKAHREVLGLGRDLSEIMTWLRHAREKTGDSRLSPLVFVRREIILNDLPFTLLLGEYQIERDELRLTEDRQVISTFLDKAGIPYTLDAENFNNLRAMALGEFDYLMVEDAAHPKQGPSHVG